ncbi:hypothetical protein [Microbacterium sp. SORGH_AS_0888]|uniref:hypothetical protein n=1 Tax=Microbacterium sp. SORGH_AS_0888 TaxID=3041791 RepID=UPI00277F126D|nr:hypothetical protein [Microbacterium sp. SORGH_AS_0888]MDQ1127976.1 hypothetical protein [Microbacterium sp. SORGH_AS_0888]
MSRSGIAHGSAVVDAPVRPAWPRRTARRAWAGVKDWVGDAVQTDPGIRRPSRRDLGAVTLLWGIGRLVNVLLLGGWYLVSKAANWGFGAPGYPAKDFLSFLTDWDADRYGRIAEIGYPPNLPLDMYGDVEPNDWAFLPVFPFLERTVAGATGMSWQLAGVLLSILFSLGATIVLFLLLRAVTKPGAAWWATVLFTFGPLSFIFVIAYAESLFLFLLFAALLLAVRRRYVWTLVIGVVCAYTRPGVLALALALGIVFLVRWARRRSDPFPLRERLRLCAAGLVIAAAGLSWSWIADTVTRTPHAYILTETAWWTPLIGTGEFVPLTPWFRFAGMYLGILGIVLVLAIMIGFFCWMWSTPVRRLGLVVAAFGLSYGLYLFGVFLPQQSLFRLMLPMAPLLGDERLSRTRRRRAVTLGGALVLQVAAVLLLWTIGYP